MIGSRLGEVKILDTFGRANPAAQGSEYWAGSTADGGRVVVQVFAEQLALDRARLSTLRDSLGAVAGLRHPNIVPILGSGLQQGRPYILMPFPAVGSLEDRWAAGLVTAVDPARVVAEITLALEFAHARGVAHGRLTPSDIWFDESGHAMIAGLGQASILPMVATGRGADDPGDYVSPEVMAGSPPTPAGDQYSLAVIALQLYTRQRSARAWMAVESRPQAGSPSERVERRTHPRPQRPELPTALADVLGRALRSDPSARHPSVTQFNHQLRIALGLEKPAAPAVVAPQPRKPAPRRSRLALLAGPLAVVLCVAVAYPALSAEPWGDRTRGDGVIPGLFDSDEQENSDSDAALSTEDAGAPVGVPPESTSPQTGSGDPPLSLSLTQSPTDGPLDPAPTAVPPTTVFPTDSPTVSIATATAVASSPTPAAATDTPAPPPDPVIDPKKCKSDPSHVHYCTPVP